MGANAAVKIALYEAVSSLGFTTYQAGKLFIAFCYASWCDYS